jgi:hypothetical protein
MSLPGALGASMVDITNGLALGLAATISADDADLMIADATDVMRAVATNTALASPDGQNALDDVVIAAGQRYHILRFADSGMGVPSFCHCWFDREQANLALVRLKLRDATRAGQS